MAKKDCDYHLIHTFQKGTRGILVKGHIGDVGDAAEAYFEGNSSL
jgi:hypothetical protein